MCFSPLGQLLWLVPSGFKVLLRYVSRVSCVSCGEIIVSGVFPVQLFQDSDAVHGYTQPRSQVFVMHEAHQDYRHRALSEEPEGLGKQIWPCAAPSTSRREAEYGITAQYFEGQITKIY